MGASMGFVPDAIQQQQGKITKHTPKSGLDLKGDLVAKKSEDVLHSPDTTGVSDSSEEFNVSKWDNDAYIACLSTIFRAHVDNSRMSTSPECRLNLKRKRATLVLQISPVLKLRIQSLKHPVTNNEGDKGNDNCGSEPKGVANPSTMKAQSLYFEVINYHDMLLDSTEAPSDMFPDRSCTNTMNGFTGRISESVYMLPLEIRLKHVINPLPFGVTVHMGNMFFSKFEIDAMIASRKEIDQSRCKWAAEYPPSNGGMRQATPQFWYGDIILNRAYSSQNVNNLDPKDQKPPSEPPMTQPSPPVTMNSNTNLINDTIDQPPPKTYYTLNYKCESGDYFSDIRKVRRFNDWLNGSISNNHNYMQDLSGARSGNANSLDLQSGNTTMAFYVPGRKVCVDVPDMYSRFNMVLGNCSQSIGAISGFEGTVCYKSPLTPLVIWENYVIPYEYLMSRLDLTSFHPDAVVCGIHKLPSYLSQYENTQMHIAAIAEANRFMQSYEFFFATDYMTMAYSLIHRKQKSNLKQQHQPEAVSSHDSGLIKVGTHLNGRTKLEFGSVELPVQISSNNDTQSSSAASFSSSSSSPAKNHLGSDEGVPVMAVPKKACHSIRNQLTHSLYEKLRFANFVNPRIEVNVNDDDLRQFLATMSDCLTTNSNSIINNGTTQPPCNITKEEPLQPLMIYLDVDYYEVSYPETLI